MTFLTLAKLTWISIQYSKMIILHSVAYAIIIYAKINIFIDIPTGKVIYFLL